MKLKQLTPCLESPLYFDEWHHHNNFAAYLSILWLVYPFPYGFAIRKLLAFQHITIWLFFCSKRLWVLLSPSHTSLLHLRLYFIDFKNKSSVPLASIEAALPSKFFLQTEVWFLFSPDKLRMLGLYFPSADKTHKNFDFTT